MYTKISYGTNFLAAVLYDAEGLSAKQKEQKKGNVRLLATNNLINRDPVGIADEMKAVASYSKCEKPVWNLSMSAPQGMFLTAAQWEWVFDYNLRGLGIDPEKHQFVIFHHADTSIDHGHMALNSVPIDGSPALSRQFVARKAKEIAPDLDKALGIIPQKGEGIREEIAYRLANALQENPCNVDDLTEALAIRGVAPTYRPGSEGICGISFQLTGDRFNESTHKAVKGSDLVLLDGTVAKWENIALQLDSNRFAHVNEQHRLKDELGLHLSNALIGGQAKNPEELSAKLFGCGGLVNYTRDTNDTVSGATYQLAYEEHEPVQGSELEIYGEPAIWTTVATWLTSNRRKHEAKVEEQHRLREILSLHLGNVLKEGQAKNPEELSVKLLRCEVLVDYKRNTDDTIFAATFQLADKDHEPVNGWKLKVDGKYARWDNIAALLDSNRITHETKVEERRRIRGELSLHLGNALEEGQAKNTEELSANLAAVGVLVNYKRNTDDTITETTFQLADKEHEPISGFRLNVDGKSANWENIAAWLDSNRTVHETKVAEEKARELEAQRQREVEAQRQRELETQRQRELIAQQEREVEAKRQRELETQRQRELIAQQEREVEAKRQREVEAKRQQEVEAKRQREVEAKRQQEVEAKRQQEVEAKRQQEVEAKRQQEVEAKRQRDLPTANQITHRLNDFYFVVGLGEGRKGRRGHFSGNPLWYWIEENVIKDPSGLKQLTDYLSASFPNPQAAGEMLSREITERQDYWRGTIEFGRYEPLKKWPGERQKDMDIYPVADKMPVNPELAKYARLECMLEGDGNGIERNRGVRI